MAFNERSACVSIFLISLASQLLASRELTRNYAPKLCPYNTFCHVNASRILNISEEMPCCAECSCHENCWLTDTCCYDQENNAHGITNLYCVSTVARGGSGMTSAYHYDGLNKGIRRYLINDKCPINFEEQDVLEACAAKEAKTVDDFIWVSDMESGRIYKNRYCAQCHRVKLWKSWKVRTGCQNVLAANFSSLADVLLSSDCSIINEAPEDERLRADAFRCFIPEVSVCNETGLWTHYDAEVEAACHANTVPYFLDIYLKYKIFKNMFCFICNQRDTMLTGGICGSGMDIKGPTSSPFSVLIDFQADETLLQDTRSCDSDEIHDKYTGRCRKLICPVGSATINGECRPLIKSSFNLGVSIVYNLKLYGGNSSEFENLDVSESDGHRILSKFLQLLNLSECPYCRVGLALENIFSIHYTKGQNVEWSIWMMFRTSESCQLDNVYKATKMALDREIEIEINTVPFTVLVEASTYVLKPDFTLSGKHVYIRDMGGVIAECTFDLAVTGLPCAAIVINEKEFTAMSSFETDFSPIVHYLAQDGVSVCVEDYFSIMENMISSVGTRVTSVTSAMLFLGSFLHI